MVDGAAGLLVHQWHIHALGDGGVFYRVADGGVSGHGAVDIAFAHGFAWHVVADDRQRTLLAEHAVSVFVGAQHHVFEAPCDGEFEQFVEDGAHGVVVGVGVEIIVDLEVRRSGLLHGLGLRDDILHLVDVVFDPMVALGGGLAHFFGHGLRLLCHGPGGDRDPRAVLGADQFPGWQAEFFPHQVVAGHIHRQVGFVVEPVEGRGSDVFFAQYIHIRAVADRFAKAFEPVVGVHHVDGAALYPGAVIASQLQGVEVAIGRADQMDFDVGNAHDL